MQSLFKLSVVANCLLLLICVVLFQQRFYKNRDVNERIQAARQAEAVLIEQNEAMKLKIAELDVTKQALQAQVSSKETSISDLRAQIEQINQEYAVLRASSYRIRTDDASVDNFKRVFEKFADKVQTISVEKVKVSPTSGKKIRTDLVYMMMPVAYVDHFVRIEQERSKFEQENVRLGEIDDLNEQIKQLNRQILSFEEQKVQEFSKGYSLAYEMFELTNEQYLKTLKENRNRHLLGTLRSVAIGIALGINF